MGSTLYSKRQYSGKKRPNKSRERAKRPKTFKSEEKAKAFATEKGLKDFTIVKLGKEKFRVE